MDRQTNSRGSLGKSPAHAILLAILLTGIAVATSIGNWEFVDQFPRNYWMLLLAIAFLPVLAVYGLLTLDLARKSDPAPLAKIARHLNRHRAWLSRGVILTLLTFPAFAAFGAIKMAIPHIQPFYADAALADLDRAIFGTDPWRITHAIIGPAGTVALDFAYQVWFVECFALVAFLNFTNDSRLQAQGLLTFWLSWFVLGNLAAIAFASVGPILYDSYYHQTRFAELMAILAATDRAHHLATFDTLRYLEAALKHGKVGGGISAMPSLHVGIAFTAFLVCRRIGERWLTFLSGLFAMTILVGSVHLAWHYAVDGIAAVFGVATIWAVAGRVASWPEQEGTIHAQSRQVS